MEFFLQILGGLACLVGMLLGMMAALYMLAYRKAQAAVAGLLRIKEAYPRPRVHLHPLPNPEWRDPARIHAMEAQVDALGFQRVGAFEVEGIADLRIVGFVRPEEALAAVIYDHPAGLWLAFRAFYRDGTTLTYANTRLGSGQDQRPGHGRIFAPNVEIAALYARIRAERPQRPFRSLAAEEFVPLYEQSHADEMDWRNSRGGPSEEELRGAMEAGGGRPSPETVRNLRRLIERRALEDLDEVLRANFLEQSLAADAAPAQQDRLLVVHDRLSVELLRAFVGRWLGDKSRTLPEKDIEYSPRHAFALFNEQLPAGERFRKLGEVKAPVPADVYLAAGPRRGE